MSINSAPIYDFAAWIDLAPEFDWNDLWPGVTAAAPTHDDTANTYTIPATGGVVYSVDGVPTAAGTYPGPAAAGTVTVTAEALDGYTLEGTASWTLTFA